MKKMLRKISYYLYPLTIYPFFRLKYPLLPKEFNKTFTIPISLIKYKVNNDSKSLGIDGVPIGGVCGGDWDLNVWEFVRSIKKNIKFKSLHDHFIGQVPWEETYLLKTYYARSLNQGKSVRGFNDFSSLVKYYQKYDSLFWDIKKNGIRTGKMEYDIPVYIDRNGNYIYTYDGNHRFYMFLLLGIKEIPVKVYIRHELWYEKLKLWKKCGDIPMEFKSHPDCALIRNEVDKLDYAHDNAFPSPNKELSNHA
jgi:hypothetical protein